MHTPPDPADVAALLRRYPLVAGTEAADLAVLSTKGVSHDHWAIEKTGLVLRIPLIHQWGLDADAALGYEAAAFERAARSGHVPHCRAVVAPEGPLPRGALIVDRIDGRPPRLPGDIEAMGVALGALHEIPAPGPAAAAPLQVHRNPVSATLHVVEEQATHLDEAGLDPDVRAILEAEIDWARRFAAHGEPDFPLCLTGTDTHPGNFLIDRDGRAWFVDLEKAAYSVPAIDLAHATLATSTGWDPDVEGTLGHTDIETFYRNYLARAGHERAVALRPWLLPLRRLVWLRTTTWFVRWRASWSKDGHVGARDDGMRNHIAGHIERMLSPAEIAAIRAEWTGTDALSFDRP